MLKFVNTAVELVKLNNNCEHVPNFNSVETSKSLREFYLSRLDIVKRFTHLLSKDNSTYKDLFLEGSNN